MVRLLVVGGHVLLEGLGGTTVKEVDASGLVLAVGGSESTREVGSKVDLLAIDLTLGENTGNSDASVGLGVCRVLGAMIESGRGPGGTRLTVTNDDSVDEESQELGLVGSVVLLEESLGVLGADGHVIGSSEGGRGGGSESRETHLG